MGDTKIEQPRIVESKDQKRVYFHRGSTVISWGGCLLACLRSGRQALWRMLLISRLVIIFLSNRLADFVWMVQLDECYWEGEDGFGIKSSREVNLCAKFDKIGRFVTPFCDREGIKKYE